MTSNDPAKDRTQNNSSLYIRDYVSEIICNTDSREEFDAWKIINKKPEIRQYRSLVIDLAYEEFCRRKENGCPIHYLSFARKFPGYEESLMCVLQVHQYLATDDDKSERNEAHWPKPGDCFGGFRLVEMIGRGAFAIVFVAEQVNVAGRRVVLKITKDGLDEVKTLSRMDHRNIVQIYSAEKNGNGFTAICMPFISRVTLFDVMRQMRVAGAQPKTAEDFVNALRSCIEERENTSFDSSKFTFRRTDQFVDTVLKVGIDIARALVYSHRQGFLHCDIKPTNILITPDGRAMLFDFNLSVKPNSRTGRFGGTLIYMPPEQLKLLSNNNFDFEATVAFDIYSLGITLYQFLTGNLPFAEIEDSGNPKETAKRLLDCKKNAVFSFSGVANLNPSLKKLICSCVAFDPQKRPKSAKEVLRALKKEQHIFHRSQRWAKAHPLYVLDRLPLACLHNFGGISELPILE